MANRERIFGKGLSGRLVRVFLLQALAISIAAVLGVYAAGAVVENVLVKEALEGEAEHFWSRYRQDPDFPRPNTNNLIGYLAPLEDASGIPAELQPLSPGYQRVDYHAGNRPLVHISEDQGQRLYLVFDEVQVSRLALLFGVGPLSAVLLIIYLLSWFGYRMSQSAVSPVVQLARKVEAIDFRSAGITDLNLDNLAESRDSEVQVLANALNHFTERLQAFLKREQNFTRNASHELRTPLAVLKANLELLGLNLPSGGEHDAELERMRRTVADMEALLDTLLILAREDESKLPKEAVIINDFLQERLESVQRVFAKPGVETGFTGNCLLELNAPDKVLAILFNNLLRNAFAYTESGEVSVFVNPHQVLIQDTGAGISREQLESIYQPFYRGGDNQQQTKGYGLGLTIVQRLCNRFGWDLHIGSEPGKGTLVTITFPKSRVLGAA